MPWLALTLATVIGALLAYIGLTIWSWRTTDGAGWRSFCMVATTDMLRTAAWLGLVLEDLDRYRHPPELIQVVVVVQFVGAVFTCALALALRGAWVFRRRGINAP